MRRIKVVGSEWYEQNQPCVTSEKTTANQFEIVPDSEAVSQNRSILNSTK
jgi:hypothetical protein